MNAAFVAGFWKEALLIPPQGIRIARKGLQIAGREFAEHFGPKASQVASKLKPGVSIPRKVMDLADKAPRQAVSMPRGGWAGGTAPQDHTSRLIEMLQGKD